MSLKAICIHQCDNLNKITATTLSDVIIKATIEIILLGFICCSFI